jgi:hypothetical protein
MIRTRRRCLSTTHGRWMLAGEESHTLKALLISRALLVKIKRDLENQIRGLLKNVGLVIGRATAEGRPLPRREQWARQGQSRRA